MGSRRLIRKAQRPHLSLPTSNPILLCTEKDTIPKKRHGRLKVHSKVGPGVEKGAQGCPYLQHLEAASQMQVLCQMPLVTEIEDVDLEAERDTFPPFF